MNNDLYEIFERQREYRKLIDQPINYVSNTAKYSDALQHLILAADELVEAREEIPFRFGRLLKNDIVGEFDTTNFKRELADTFIFMINAMIIMDIDPGEFINFVKAKQVRNVERIQKQERFILTEREPVIIIDGPDGVGKSTICQILSERYKIPIVKISKDKGFAHDEEMAHLFHLTIDQFNTPMILDRCFPSTYVYSMYFNRKYNLSYIEKLFKDRDVFVFIIDRDQPFREDEYMSIDTFSTIRDLYLGLANQYKWKIVRNDTTIDSCVQRIIDELQF